MVPIIGVQMLLAVQLRIPVSTHGLPPVLLAHVLLLRMHGAMSCSLSEGFVEY